MLTVSNLREIVHDEYVALGRRSVGELPRRFRNAEAFFGSRPVDEIGLGDLHAYVRARREAGIGSGAIKVELSHLHHGFALAIRVGRLPAAAMPTFPRLKVRNARRVFVDRPVLDALLSHLPEHLRPVFQVALLTGWRKTAILSRQWRSVDFEGGWVSLEEDRNKGGFSVKVPLIPALREILLVQRRRANELQLRFSRTVPWCFFYLSDTAHYRAGARIIDFDHAWTEARDAAGMGKNVRFHDLRRGAIRTLRRAGVSEHEVMEWVGLKTRYVFDAYDVIDEERKREVGAKFQGYYEGQAGLAPSLSGFVKPAPMLRGGLGRTKPAE